MKKQFLLLFLFGFLSLSFAQDPEEYLDFSEQQSKWRTGGGFALGFGNDSYFGFNLSPFFGYQFSRIIEGGASFGLDYGKNDFYKRTLFSIGPYMNFNFTPTFFGRAHYEYFTGNAKYEFDENRNNQTSINESALWLGVGYQGGGRTRFQTGLMYNVLYDEDSKIFGAAFRPYAGVSFGF